MFVYVDMIITLRSIMYGTILDVFEDGTTPLLVSIIWSCYCEMKQIFCISFACESMSRIITCTYHPMFHALLILIFDLANCLLLF